MEKSQIYINPSIVYTQPYALSDLIVENVGTDENPEIRFRSDISLLLYQKTLSDYDEVALKEWLSGMGEKHPSIDFTDEQFLSSIKSRYIQSAQDVQSYLESIEHEFNQLSVSVNQLQQQQQESAESSSNTNT